MSCLGCNLIETASVTLRDAKVVCSSCPAWRLECEAREVLKKGLEERRAYLEAIPKSRAEDLKRVITQLWEKKHD